MELSFINSEKIDFFSWFMQTVSKIYGIENLPSSLKESKSNTVKLEHEIVHAFCEAEFNNWNEDPMLNDSCKGSVFRFKHKDSPFLVKFHVAIAASMIGPLNTGILSIADDDPHKEKWITQLKTIIPDLKDTPGKVGNCTKTCQILNKYWVD